MSAGFDWNTSKSTGVFIPAELGYLTGFSDVKLPQKYDVGFYEDTSQYTKGRQTGNPTVTGTQAGYLQLQQTVWRPDMATHQSLTAFAGAIWYDGNAAYRGQYYAGLYDRAPFGGLRPDDTVGLLGTMLDINQSNTSCVPGICTGTPHGAAPFSRSWIMEANYGIGIIPGVTATPYLAYVAQPFSQGNPTRHIQNDMVFGAEFVVVFEQLFNFPTFVPH